MPNQPLDSSSPGDRAARIAEVVEQCLRRRAAGQTLTDEQVIARNGELMPELGRELRGLKLIQDAMRAAHTPETIPPEDSSTKSRALDLAPEALAGYEIIEEDHRGGQGIVYRAVQKSTRRKVAIKVMREGRFANPQDRLRFEREVELLAQLRHPNIVTMHDSGVAAGHYFFVMDYISGESLDRWIRSVEKSKKQKVEVEQLLRLFAKIADAVNAAHLRGIIHRDLKPSNIRIDAKGEPYILDFGLAKITLGAVGEAGAHREGILGPAEQAMTVTGQFIGSLPWASPEQAEGIPRNMDLRTDVYSLGVMLYQALTGRFPYETTGGMRDVLDRIQRAEPAPLRERAAGFIPAVLERRGAKRGTGTAGVNPAARPIDDEIETIVLQCLQKAPERRYQSAGELARDLRHYLAGEPIEAKRDSTFYVLRKHLRRYRLPLAAALVFFAVVNVGLLISVTSWREAENARSGERKQRELAEANAQTAETRAGTVTAVNQFLLDVLGASDLYTSRGPRVTIREALDEAARKIDAGAFQQQPEIDAAVRTSIGMTYGSLGLYSTAEPYLRSALEIRQRLFGEHPDVADSLSNLGSLVEGQQKFTEAEQLFRQALAMQCKLLGAETLVAAMTRCKLGLTLKYQARFTEAESILRETLAIQRKIVSGPHDQTATILNYLAIVLRELGKLDDAEPLYREALAMQRELLGDEHLDVADSLNNLGGLLWRQDRFREAETMQREALAIRRKLLPAEHEAIALSLQNLGTVLAGQGQLDEAEELFREALAMELKIQGEEHGLVAHIRTKLAALLRDRGRLDEAEPLFRQALATQRRLFGDEHTDVARTLHHMARYLHVCGDLTGAEPLFQEALAIRRKRLPQAHPDIAETLDDLGALLTELGRPAESEPLLRECVATRLRALPQGDWRIADAESLLGESLAALGRYEEAEPLLLQSFNCLIADPNAPADRTQRTLERLTHFYEASTRPEKADAYTTKMNP